MTQSRWPKFMSWQHSIIKDACKTVFYMDSSAHPRLKLIGDFSRFLINLSQSVLDSNVGFAVPLHPARQSISEELSEVLRQQKDIGKNVISSLNWFNQQSDFVDNIPLYQLKYFMFATGSVHWRKLTEFFWGHYSSELYSWRDQPLFAYSLHHFGYTPLNISNNLFSSVRIGYNGHHYSEEDDYSAIFKYCPQGDELYSKEYHDVASLIKKGAVINGFDHFMKYGMKEGRVYSCP